MKECFRWYGDSLDKISLSDIRQTGASGIVTALHEIPYGEVWTKGKIADRKAKIEAAGFDPSLADSGLLSGAETYAANLEDAVRDNVFGSPFYVVDTGQSFWGQDRIADLDAHLAGKL